jgi:hypothetical protein
MPTEVQLPDFGDTQKRESWTTQPCSATERGK